MMMAYVDGGSAGRGRDTAKCAGVDPTKQGGGRKVRKVK